MAVIIPGCESYKYSSANKKESAAGGEDFHDLARLAILSTIINM